MYLSRRSFLKLSGFAWGSLLLPPPPPEEAPQRPKLLGRTVYAVYVYDRPSFQAKQLGMIAGESILNIYEVVQSPEAHYNRAWYRVVGGYVYSGTVQPVRWQTQRPTLDIPKIPDGAPVSAGDGVLGEITIPYAQARNFPHPNAETVYRLYYGTTYWIVEAKKGEEDGRIWYKIQDDRYPGMRYWVLGSQVRLIDPSEVTPISPEVENKRIEVSLDHQTFRCYEGDTLVKESLCATGIYLRMENDERVFGTPRGNWKIDRKRPTRHMAADDPGGSGFDLPGVPWTSYFHWWGTAIHGTYWHNDFGAPRSHGCVNVPTEVAKWVFRWTLPVSGLVKETKGAEGGTPMVVAY